VPNVLAALTVGLALGVELGSGMERACRFQGLPHRLELVSEVGGVRFYNDSVATTPESTVAALSAFSEPILLIAGGKDKGIDYTGFAREVARRTRTVVLLGATAPKLAQLIGDHLPKVGGPAVYVVESLAEGLDQLLRQEPNSFLQARSAMRQYDQRRTIQSIIAVYQRVLCARN